MKKSALFSFVIFSLAFIGCTKKTEDQMKIQNEIKELKLKISQYAPAEINYDESILDENRKKIVEILYKAGKIIDTLFLKQVYSKNLEIAATLRNSPEEIDKLRLQYFEINFGPFDRFDNDKPFIGDEPKPAGANFYPVDMTRDEFENFIKLHPEKQKEFTSEFTVIRRKNGELIAIPYSEYFKKELEELRELLLEAARYAEDQSLKNYLIKRAEDFIKNDYYESDIAWMDLQDPLIEIVIGPYEVYEDKLFNYKAAYEMFLNIVDINETKKLKIFENYLPYIEKNLPLAEKYKKFGSRGLESPIKVVNLIYSAGDTKAGSQTLAFNLPNDERVRKAKGSKKVLMKNVHEAKFNKILKPIAERIIDSTQLEFVNFDAFFNHTLMHEISHGVGPGIIVKDGKKTEVKAELKETYSKLEECKADVLGMYNNVMLIDQKIYPYESEKSFYVTFLAGIFRSVRFGVNSAHGGGNAIIFNYLFEKGAYVYDEKNGKISVNFEKIKDAIKELANLILTIQAEGNYEAAKIIIDKYAIETEIIKKVKSKIADIPIDIKPIFEIETKI